MSVAAIGSAVIGLIGQWLVNRQEISKAKQETKVKQIQNSATWEAEQAKNSMHSWKDEWFTIVLSTPILAVSWGVAIDSSETISKVNEAFDVLNNLPDWYTYLLGIAVMASFGFRGVKEFMNLKKGDAK